MTLNPALRAYTLEELAKFDTVVVQLFSRCDTRSCLVAKVKGNEIPDFVKKSVAEVVQYALDNYEPSLEGRDLHDRITRTIDYEGPHLAYTVNGCIVFDWKNQNLDVSAGLPSMPLNNIHFLYAPKDEEGKDVLMSHIHVGSLNEFLSS